MNANEIGLLLSVVAPVFLAIAGCSVAIKKKRNGILWFIICLFSGLLGLIVVGCSKEISYDEDLDFKESDTLGWIMLIVSIIWLGITFWYGWSAAKSYHDQMIMNFFLGR